MYNMFSHLSTIPEAIPEFPSFLILPLFMIATLLTVIVYRKVSSTNNKNKKQKIG
jgi:hypothetical protein